MTLLTQCPNGDSKSNVRYHCDTLGHNDDVDVWWYRDIGGSDLGYGEKEEGEDGEEGEKREVV